MKIDLHDEPKPSFDDRPFAPHPLEDMPSRFKPQILRLDEKLLGRLRQKRTCRRYERVDGMAIKNRQKELTEEDSLKTVLAQPRSCADHFTP